MRDPVAQRNGTTSKGFLPVFVPPEHLDLIRDYIFSKGSEAKVYTPQFLVKLAVEEYLSNRGYRVQVDEIRQARTLRRQVKPINMDYLDATQREAAFLIMSERNFDEEHAIRWVLEHKDEVERIYGH